jgi:hypothetical protein
MSRLGGSGKAGCLGISLKWIYRCYLCKEGDAMGLDKFRFQNI